MALPLAGMAQKKVTATVEIMPNYLWHIFASSNLWDKSENPYGEEWGYTIPAIDRQFMYDNRELVAWGNGRGGMFYQAMFFTPLRNEISIGEYIAYLEEAGVGIPEPLASTATEMTRIIRDNYPAFEWEVWPAIEPKLLRAKEMIEARFAGTDPIALWERNLGMEFSGDRKELVLSYANGINNFLPSANNITAERNNFGILPEDWSVDYVCGTVLHEIGIFTFMPVNSTLQSDISLQTDFLKSRNTVYVACETFAEKRKDDIFGGTPRVFLPQWEADYNWFYDYFRKHDSRCANIEQLLRSAIAEYVNTFQVE
jgi:hypothetical protein